MGGYDLIFFLPRLAPGNPIQDKLLAQMEQGGGVTDIRAMVEVYNVKFGLDKPLWQQYFTFLRDTATLDLGQSIAYYPSRTMDMIGGALPWTIGLLTTTTVLGFLIGTILGALTVWRGSAAFYRYLVPFLMIFSAIPFYLIGLVLVYVFAYLLGWFPLGGGKGIRTDFVWSVSLILEDSSSLRPSGRLDPAFNIGNLGVVDARHDGDGARGGLYDLCRGVGPEELKAVSAIRASKRYSSAGNPAGAVIG